MKVLAIGAHPDDLELGCGATLLRHHKQGDEIALLVMTSGEAGPEDERPRGSEQEDAAAILNAKLFWGGFEDSAVSNGRAAVDAVQRVLLEYPADVIYTHSPNDTHQDHRATASATLAAARRRTRVLMYEAPTSRAFDPSMFIDVAGYVDAKLELIRAHLSQVLKNGLVDLEAVEAQARYRGFQARMREAEAFEVHRFVWDLSMDEHNAPSKGHHVVKLGDLAR